MQECRLRYEPPKVEIFTLSERLNLLVNFPTNGDVDDWNNGNELDNEIDDLINGKDWLNGGGLGTD